MNTRATQQHSVNFGRRGTARPVVSSRQIGAMPERSASQSTVTFETRHAIRFNFVAFALLVAGAGAVKDLMDHSSPGVFGIQLSPFEQNLTWICAIGVLFIAFYWLYQSLARAPAIRMTNREITAYTFYGRKTVPWSDINRITTRNDDNYGVVLEVYAKSASPLSFIFKKGFAMPVGLTESSLEDIVAAIRMHRPDLI